MEGSFISLIKGMYGKHSKMALKGERLNALPPRLETRQGLFLITYVQYFTGSHSYCNMANKINESI